MCMSFWVFSMAVMAPPSEAFGARLNETVIDGNCPWCVIESGSVVVSKPLDAQELLRAIDAAIAQDREARLKRAEMAKCGRYASSDAWRASALAVRGSRSPQQSRPRPNSATVRSPFRFIVDRSCANWRPHPWQIWSKWQEHWGFPNLMKTIGVYIKT